MSKVYDMDEENTCRTCTRRQKSSIMLSLDVDNRNAQKSHLRYMLEKCVPEMMLDMCRNPVICESCAAKLELCYEFISNCHHIERMISSYLENNDIQAGSLDLFQMINQTSINIANIKVEPSGNDDVIDTTELVDCDEFTNVKSEWDARDKCIEEPNHKTDDTTVGCVDNNNEESSSDSTSTPPPREAAERTIKSDLDELDDTETDENADNSDSATLTSKGYKKRNFRCDKCQYRAYSPRLLQKHKQHKCKQTAKLHRCDVCEFQTARGHSLKRHMLTHGGLRPYVCKHCNRGFVEQCTYRLHLLTHAGDKKPHRCEQCGAGFLRRWDLKMHMQRHDGSSRLRCEKCHKTFSDKRAHEAHMTLHGGQFKYSCADCNFGTSWKKNLVRHHESLHS